MRLQDRYQLALIASLGLVFALFSVFIWREAFPEYKIYQNAYEELEEFRSQITKEPPPPFKEGVKQILLPDEKHGVETVDRCTTCHVALTYPHFSPTRVLEDINGRPVVDEIGIPVQERNPNYVFDLLDKQIVQLEGEGKIAEAKKLRDLKVAKVGEHEFDMQRVLASHPLIGKETRPFQYHPVDDYGCVVCHAGNGRSIVSDRAHGPVFDGQYEIGEEEGQPQFTEIDPQNDPKFASVYNRKPGERLLFQTTPLLVDGLLQAKCVQCHQTSETAFDSLFQGIKSAEEKRRAYAEDITLSFENQKEALLSLILTKKALLEKGLASVTTKLKSDLQNYDLSKQARESIAGQLAYLEKVQGGEEKIRQVIDQDIFRMVGNVQLEQEIEAKFPPVGEVAPLHLISDWASDNRDNPQATGSLFVAQKAFLEEQKLVEQLSGTKLALDSIQKSSGKVKVSPEIDAALGNYERGKELYVSQACYACHKIAGFSRGGVGPELTKVGYWYPWFLKQGIVWPQAEGSMTMPNYRLDHEELADLMTFLLAQTGRRKGVSEVEYERQVKEWESMVKMPWEKPIARSELDDLGEGMRVFAEQGCAACHRVKGYTSSVGFALEKQKPSFEALYEEKRWFQDLFPETVVGSQIVKLAESRGEELDRRIVEGVHGKGVLEQLDPRLMLSFYTPFHFAMRAKDHELQGDAKKAWKERIDRLLMMFIQEYGFGRLICPKLNWTGVIRSDQWLMEHFANPGHLAPGTIMPAFPFDRSKFVVLTHMLDVLGQKNTEDLQKIWQERGFDPALAFHTTCAQCHGETRKGNGPVAEWVHPIPKNLADPVFMRNLTKENVAHSIIHGVPGTPMPPYGEASADKMFPNKEPVYTKAQIDLLADWLFDELSKGQSIVGNVAVPKWEYSPQDAKDEMDKEGQSLLVEMDGEKDLFVEEPSLHEGDKPSYFIREKYYTKENIAAGKEFFELNCASCHGKEADGSGLRAGVMGVAKPRNLTNVSWLQDRDDLRMIRSIKYGIPGTAMTPWGDLTTSLQRLQLVMFIRNQSAQEVFRRKVEDSLYKGFDAASLLMDQTSRKELDMLNKKLIEEKTVYQELGNAIASRGIEKSQEIFLSILQKLEGRFFLRDGKIQMKEPKNLASLWAGLASSVPPGKEHNLVQEAAALTGHLQAEEGKLFQTYRESK